MQKNDFFDMKNYLTPTEQKIIRLFRQSHKIHTSSEIKELFPEKNINQILTNLTRKQYILRLKRSYYVLKEAFLDDPYRIASELGAGPVCLITALRVHNLIDYEPSTIFVMTGRKSYRIKLLDYRLHFINLKHKTGIEEKGGILVTDTEKTIIDCLAFPESAGGYGNVIKALEEADIKWSNMLRNLAAYDKSSLYQKLGYFLMRLGKKTPDHVMRRLKSRVKNNLRLIPNSRISYTYNKEWRIMDNLGERRWD
ncbi:MAG: type IV toxin-antitoxin system AbiEi family antitoxin domain-containing protein [Nanobdellota archaeon]